MFLEGMTVRKKSCPVGYASLTYANIGGMRVDVLLDSGASVSAIPEELLLVLIEMQRRDPMHIQDPRYPLIGIQWYETPQALVGIDTSASEMQTTYGVELALEFIPHTGSRGDGKNTVVPIYFKVLPAGTSSFKGVYLGCPILDNQPHGMGWRVTESTHHFDMLGYGTPRVELARRRGRDERRQRK